MGILGPDDVAGGVTDDDSARRWDVVVAQVRFGDVGLAFALSLRHGGLTLRVVDVEIRDFVRGVCLVVANAAAIGRRERSPPTASQV